jgi:arylamine N-acetyltransferase
LCAADMAEKDIHAASMVQLEGAEYLIDVGYAAPFLNPLPRSLKTNYVVELGWDRYVLKPQDPHGRSRLELHRGGTLKHGYMVKPEPRTFRDFKGVIKSSFRANATFLNSILLARFYPGRSVVIHNLSLIQSCGGQSEVRRLANLNGVVEAAEEHFEMPGSLVAESIKDLSQLQDAWSDLSSGGRSRT